MPCAGVYTKEDWDQLMRRVHPRTILDSESTQAVQILCEHSNVDAGTNVLNVFCLPDTGAVSNTYIDGDTARWLQIHGIAPVGCNSLVCSGVGDKACYACLGVVTFSIRIFNELMENFETLLLEAEIVEKLAHPFVIGLIHIRKHKLSQKWQTFFSGEDRRGTLTVAGGLSNGYERTPPHWIKLQVNTNPPVSSPFGAA